MIESTEEETPITRLSPFIIEKVIYGIAGQVKGVKKLRNETLLVEVFRKKQADNLLKTTEFFSQKVRVYAHTTLNSSRGIIRDPMLKGCSDQEVLEGLKEKGVTGVRRITITKNGKKVDTNTFVLTFNTPMVPKDLKIFYRVIKVDIYIPNPLRCYNCQKFGHHEDRCKSEKTCGQCGKKDPHPMRDCKAPPHCVNCGGDHPANSKECTAWLREKEIQRLKYTLNLPFAEAHKQVEKQTVTTYASVIKSTSHSVVCKDASTQTDPLVTPRSTITKPDTRPSSIHTNIPHYGPISAKSSSNASPSVIARSAPKQKINLEGMGGSCWGVI